MTPHTWRVLGLLDLKAPKTVRQIAEELAPDRVEDARHMQRGGVSYGMDRLVDRGLVHRVRCATGAAFILSTAGQAALCAPE